MGSSVWETIILSLPNLSVAVVFLWYLYQELKECKRGRNAILKENKELAIRLARVEEKVSYAHPDK